VSNEQHMYRQHKRMRVGTFLTPDRNTATHNTHSPRTVCRRRRSAAPPRTSGPNVRSFNLSHDSNRRAQRTRVMADH
jgi:hypothetical protein